MKLTFTEDTNLEQKRRECLDYLNRTKVDVGLTSSASGRSRFLMALHEHGAPGAHIPARPVIAPALGTEEAREAVSRELLNAVSAANRGSREETEAALEKAGEVQSYDKTAPSGRERRYYRLTEKGAGRLEEKVSQWRLFSDSVNTVLSFSPSAG